MLENLKEESNLIIYIIGLILLIIWKDNVSSAPTFETQTIERAGSAAAAINRIHLLSSRSLQLTAEQYG